MNKNSTFLRCDTKITNYMLYPTFLLALDLSNTAKQIYVLLFNRARLSMKEGWADEGGKVYIFYTLKNLAADSGKSIRTVQTALKDLEAADLISLGKQIKGRSRKIHVKTVANFSTYVVQNTSPLGCEKLPTNKNNINKNNIDKYSFEEGESL